MIAPAPREPSADDILTRWQAWVGNDLSKGVPNLRRIYARESREKRRKAAKRTARPPA